MSTEPPLPVFVYGTLRPGRQNWDVVARRVDHHRPARLPGHRLYLLDYPVVVEDDDRADAGRSVVGDLLWLDASRYTDSLAILDRFEDHRTDDADGSLYRRERRPVRLTTVTSTVAAVAAPLLDAWVYVAGPAHAAQLTPAHELTTGEYVEG